LLHCKIFARREADDEYTACRARTPASTLQAMVACGIIAEVHAMRVAKIAPVGRSSLPSYCLGEDGACLTMIQKLDLVSGLVDSGQIRLGMTRKELQAILGAPDEVGGTSR
jgi:hypothetical protein